MFNTHITAPEIPIEIQVLLTIQKIQLMKLNQQLEMLTDRVESMATEIEKLSGNYIGYPN